jgi:hypothetical protein
MLIMNDEYLHPKNFIIVVVQDLGSDTNIVVLTIKAVHFTIVNIVYKMLTIDRKLSLYQRTLITLLHI